MTKGCRWNEWNVAHIAKHGIAPGEAEYVIRHARPPYPGRAREDTYEVFGQSQWGAYLHVVYVDRWNEETLYVIHARPMTESEKRRFRRGNR